MNGLAIVLIIGTIIVVMFMLTSCNKSLFKFDNTMYQYDPPSIDLQEDYFKCIARECGGNTHDYNCLEKCHLKAFRRDMMTLDRVDLVCHNYRNDEDAYYRCLDEVYADYKYP